MLCHPNASLDEYLTVPRDLNIDLNALKTDFCRDIDELKDQLFEKQLDLYNILDSVSWKFGIFWQ